MGGGGNGEPGGACGGTGRWTWLKYYVAPQGKREAFHFHRKRNNPRAHVEEEWVLDKVLKVQGFGKGRKRHRKWHVLWKGHDKPTWEPASSFFQSCCPALA